MPVPIHMILRPIIYLLAIISFWQTAKRNLDSRWRFGAILSGLFVVSVGLSIFDIYNRADGVVTVGGYLVSYGVLKAFLESMGLFAIVASLLLLLRRRLDVARAQVRQLARIAEESADAIVAVDREGTIVSWNRGAAMLFDHLPEEMEGQKVRRLMSADDWEVFSAAIEECIKEGFVKGVNLGMLARGRKAMEVEATFSLTTDEDGRANGVSLFIRDVTGQKETMTEAILASRTAAVGKLAGGVVGEFGNVLTVISGHAQLGASVDSLDEAQDSFSAIESSVGRAKSVISNLLAYAKRQPPHKSAGQLSEAADAAIALLDREFKEGGVEVLRMYEPVKETAFDREQMTQVFVNLISNSLNSMRATGGRIEVSISAMREYIQATVKDNGPGLPEELLGTVFEPFADDRLGEGIQTVGLGLYVCREIVKYHSGNITVESDSAGTAVHLHMPITAAVSEEGKCPTAAKLRGGESTIAVVDQDGMIRDLLSQVLEGRGFEVRAFADAGDAQSAEVGDKYDLVFVDISVPAREGGRYVEHLQKAHPCSVVAMVGEAIEADELKRIKEGLFGTLRKPFGLDEVEELCGRIAPESLEEAKAPIESGAS